MKDLFVEKAALGEASEAELRQLGEGAEAEVQKRRDSNAEILARYPAGPVVAEVLRRAKKAREKRPQPRRTLVFALTTCTALAGVLWLALPHGHRIDPITLQPAPRDDEVRFKGLKPRLVAFRQADSGAVELGDGAAAHAGDVIQLGYVAADARYGVLLSIDGRGGVTLHFPAPTPQAAITSAELSRGKLVRLNQAFMLDDAPKFERFFLLTSDQAQTLSVEAALTSARQLAQDLTRAETDPLALPKEVWQTSLLLRKN